MQLNQFNALIGKLWDKFGEMEEQCHGEARTKMESLKCWIKQEVAAAMEPGFSNPLAIKDSILRVMTAQVTLLPSQQDFLVEGQDTLLEAAMRAGISLNYGCSGGNCGLCKGKVVAGQVKKTRHHDFTLSEAEKEQGIVLMCSNTAVSDITLKASVTGGVQNIPFQHIAATVKAKVTLSDEVMLLHLQTPRSQRLRFLAGQNVLLRVGQSFTAELPIASCPCDDRNLLFHVRRQSGNLFSDYVFEHLKSGEVVEVEGPRGEFILHEKTERPLYFFAFDGGFAPIKSLVEHAMSLEVQTIHLHWIASAKEQLYLPNVGRAWGDALDNFHYSEHTTGFDLRVLNAKREAQLLHHLQLMTATDPAMTRGDVYLAGPEAAIGVAEQFFLSQGMPKSRVFVEAVR
jgi:CDP-4-dehydro-6-deoxyglucose reductase